MIRIFTDDAQAREHLRTHAEFPIVVILMDNACLVLVDEFPDDAEDRNDNEEDDN